LLHDYSENNNNGEEKDNLAKRNIHAGAIIERCNCDDYLAHKNSTYTHTIDQQYEQMQMNSTLHDLNTEAEFFI